MEKIIKNTEIAGFITDTVWGLGCLPFDKVGIEKIYEIKNRDRTKPLILMSHSILPLEKYVKNIPSYAKDLIKKHLPGGLTLIFEKSELCPEEICAGHNTVGIRIPNSKDFWELCKNIEGEVLATTSLNISNEEPAQNYSEAVERFGKVAKIIKPKYTEVLENKASTVILCGEDGYTVLRQGSVEV